MSRGFSLPLQKLDLVQRWIQRNQGQGGVAIELCPKANHIHLQIAVRFPGGKQHGMDKDAVRTSFKKFCDIRRGSGHQVIIQEYGSRASGSQNQSTMMGYIQKDEGARHYAIKTVGYTAAELEQCKESHQSVRVSHEQDKDLMCVLRAPPPHAFASSHPPLPQPQELAHQENVPVQIPPR